MRRGATLLSILILGACGGSNSAASHSTAPSATSTPASATPPTAGPSPGPGPASLVHCTTAIPAGDNLVIGTIVGDPTIVVRDIQDPANAENLCTIDSAALSPQFVSASAIAYETSDNQIVKADLTSNTTTIMATYGTDFGSGQYAISPDGRSITYIDGNTWHLAGPSGNRTLTTLPAVPGRGGSYEDDSFLAFSPDGQYVALFQTFHTGGTGEAAPDQVRRVNDGHLVYSTSGATMSVWASVPSRLFFRDGAGNVHRWDPNSGLSAMTSLHWFRPKSSPDGRWIAYTTRNTTTGVGTVGFYSVQSNSVQSTTPAGRAGATFLSNDLVWYAGEKACTTNCGLSQVTPTGVTYIYSITGASEITSRLASVYDAWPRSTAPGL